jgi:hypothetical protein
MAVYSAGFSVSGVNTANSVLAQLRAAATGSRPRLLECGIFIAVAPTTAPVIGLGRTAGAGTTPTQVASEKADPAEATASTLVDTGWATRPVLSAAPYIRRMTLVNAIGNGVIWPFYDIDLLLALSGTIGFVDIAASGATTGTFDGYFTWEE